MKLVRELNRKAIYSYKKTNLCCVFLTGMLIGVYILDYMPFVSFNNNIVFRYFIKPGLWLVLGLYVWMLPRTHPSGRLRLKRFLVWLGLICAVFYILLLMVGGMIEGFGKSPYSFTLFGIITNVFFAGSALIGREASRSFLICNLSKKHSIATIAFVSFLLTFVTLPFSKFFSIKSRIELMEYLGGFILPALGESMMASYLAYLGGFYPSLVYMGTLETFRWLCPVLPDMGWLSKALLGALVPLFSMILVQQLYAGESREMKRTDIKAENPVGWITTSIISVLIIWFAVGVFPIFPSVIATGSMEPGIKPGDIIIIKKVDARSLKVGDIVQYRKEKIDITHRIIDIEKEGGVMYKTKGDNNSAADSELVSPQQIRGKVLTVVPKVGWLTLFLRQGRDVPDVEVEF